MKRRVHENEWHRELQLVKRSAGSFMEDGLGADWSILRPSGIARYSDRV